MNRIESKRIFKETIFFLVKFLWDDSFFENFEIEVLSRVNLREEIFKKFFVQRSKFWGMTARDRQVLKPKFSWNFQSCFPFHYQSTCITKSATLSVIPSPPNTDHPWKFFKESIRNFSMESQTELFHFSQFVHFTWNAVNWSAFSSFEIYNFSYLQFNNEFVQLTIQLYKFSNWKILISINLIWSKWKKKGLLSHAKKYFSMEFAFASAKAIWLKFIEGWNTNETTFSSFTRPKIMQFGEWYQKGESFFSNFIFFIFL